MHAAMTAFTHVQLAPAYAGGEGTLGGGAEADGGDVACPSPSRVTLTSFLPHADCNPPPLLSPPALAALPPPQQAQWQELAGRLCERMTRCVISALDHYAIPFAEMLPPFLTLYVENALIALDAATVSRMRGEGWGGGEECCRISLFLYIEGGGGGLQGGGGGGNAALPPSLALHMGVCP